jgi:hypothetical protein
LIPGGKALVAGEVVGAGAVTEPRAGFGMPVSPNVEPVIVGPAAAGEFAAAGECVTAGAGEVVAATRLDAASAGLVAELPGVPDARVCVGVVLTAGEAAGDELGGTIVEGVDVGVFDRGAPMAGRG